MYVAIPILVHFTFIFAAEYLI